MGQSEEAGGGGVIAEVAEEVGVIVVVAAVAEVDEVAGVQDKFEDDKDLGLKKEEEEKKW